MFELEPVRLPPDTVYEEVDGIVQTVHKSIHSAPEQAMKFRADPLKGIPDMTDTEEAHNEE